MIEHHIDDDSSDRYIHPYRESKTSNFFMLLPFLAKSVPKSFQNHGHHNGRQNNVRYQNQQINCFDKTKFWKVLRAGMVMVD